MKSRLIATGCIMLFIFSVNGWAEDLAAKEDTTPPPPEGALTLDQIPAIESKTEPEVKPPPPQT